MSSGLKAPGKTDGLSAEEKEEQDLILQNMSDAEKREYGEAFRVFDKDGDGNITVLELHEVFSHLGFKYTEEQLTKMVQKFDVDGNGEIDLDEFIFLLRKKQPASKRKGYDPDRELKQAFRVFDIDGDGHVTPDELSKVLRALGEKLSRQEIEFMVKAVDQDSDGTIDFKEFKAMMKMGPIPQATMNKLG